MNISWREAVFSDSYFTGWNLLADSNNGCKRELSKSQIAINVFTSGIPGGTASASDHSICPIKLCCFSRELHSGSRKACPPGALQAEIPDIPSVRSSRRHRRIPAARSACSWSCIIVTSANVHVTAAMQTNTQELALASCTANLTLYKLGFQISLDLNKQNNDLKRCGRCDSKKITVKSLRTWQCRWKTHKNKPPAL